MDGRAGAYALWQPLTTRVCTCTGASGGGGGARRSGGDAATGRTTGGGRAARSGARAEAARAARRAAGRQRRQRVHHCGAPAGRHAPHAPLPAQRRAAQRVRLGRPAAAVKRRPRAGLVLARAELSPPDVLQSRADHRAGQALSARHLVCPGEAAVRAARMYI